jgi:hypothetical protein
VLRATGVAGTFATGGVSLGAFSRTAAADEGLIETCGGEVDIVVAIDYSGSIRGVGTWPDIQSGTESCLDVVPEDVQLGLVRFGDAPDDFEYDAGDLMRPATASNVTLLKAGIPASAPPQENATHMPGALAFADAILENEGRAGRQIIVLITDGGPNYQNGVVGDGASPPADDTTFPYGTSEFTGGTTGSENGVAGESGELTETTETATGIKDAGLLAKYEFEDGDFVLEEGDDSLVSYQSYESKDEEENEPVSATFSTDYCRVYGFVKSGQSLSVQELLADENGLVTAVYSDPYAISFVAFYCTEEAANAALEAFPSGGRGGGNGGNDDERGRGR